MSDQGDSDQVRKIVVLDLMRIIFGGHKGYNTKIVFVNPALKSEHLTFSITDKRIDFHKTYEPSKENPQKRYESLSKFNFDMASLRVHLDKYEDVPIAEVIKLFGMKEIDVHSMENSQRQAVSMQHLFSRADRRKRKIARFTSFSQAPLYKLDELDKIGFRMGFIPDDKDKYRLPVAILVKDTDQCKYYIMDVPDRIDLEEIITRIGMDGREFLKDLPLHSKRRNGQ